MVNGLRVLVTGGRDFADINFLEGFLDRFHAREGISLLIEGEATGADLLSKDWADAKGIPVLPFDAAWDTKHAGFNIRAGHGRNQRMLDEGKPNVLIVFRGGRGTLDMVKRAKVAGIRIVFSFNEAL